MKLNELKQGMVCEMRNKLSFTVVDNDKAFRYDMYFCLSGNYENNLTHKRDKQHDIMKVSYGDKVVWERKKSTIWVPEEGDRFYYSTISGDVSNFINGREVSQDIFKTILVFKTREEAEKQLLKQQATIRVIKEIARLNEGWLPNWKDEQERKFYVMLVGGVYLDYDSSIRFKFRDNNLYLKSEELAEQLIKTHEQDLKIMLEVE